MEAFDSNPRHSPKAKSAESSASRAYMLWAIISGVAALAVGATAIAVHSHESDALFSIHHRAAAMEARLRSLSATIDVDARLAHVYGDRPHDVLLSQHISEFAEQLAKFRALQLAPVALAAFQSAREAVTRDYERARILGHLGHSDDAREAVSSANHGAMLARSVAAQDALWSAVDAELDSRGSQLDAEAFAAGGVSIVLIVIAVVVLNRALIRHRMETHEAVSTIEESARAELRGVQQSSEHFVQTVVDASLDAFILITRDGIVREWNRRAEELFQHSMEDAVGRRLADLIIPESERSAHNSAIARFSIGASSRVVEQRIEVTATRKDGSEFPVELSVVPIHRNGDTSFAGFVRDVSDRRIWEDALRANEQRLRLALQSAEIGMWDWDLATNRTHFSEHWYAMLGFEPGELPMTFETWRQLCHPDDVSKALTEVHAHLRGDTQKYRCEIRLRCKDGSQKWVLAVGEVSLRDSDGKPVRMTGVHVDIDELRRTEADRRQLQNILQVAIDHLPARVFWKDLDCRYLGCSKSFATDAGEEGPLHLIGKSDDDVIWHEHAERYRSDDKAVMESGIPKLNYEEPFTAPDGSPGWVRTSKVPLRQDDGTVFGVVGTYEDITAERIAKEKTAQALEIARAASRAKSEFLANMSHEIRTPMNAILGFAELLDEEAVQTGSSRVHEFVATIRRNGTHLLTIINDILDLSKIEAGKMAIERVSVEPAKLLSEAMELMQAQAESKGIGLSYTFEGPIPVSIQSDPVRVRQILMNLIGNAIKFTEVGGVDITGTLVRESGSPATLQFSIRDTGIGISEQNMSKLFDAFQQADTSMARKFGGTGLGLQISQRLARMLGGEILVQSELNKGSTFTFVLDVDERDLHECAQFQGKRWSRAAAASTKDVSTSIAIDPAPAKVAAPPTGELAGARILLVEDGPDNQRLLSFHLKRAGAVVTLANNGRVAVEMLCGPDGCDGKLIEPVPFDLILMDMQMPEMDGYAATTILRSKGFRGHIVALTAHAMEHDSRRCLEAGCDAYATKPISKTDLIDLCKSNLAAARTSVAERATDTATTNVDSPG